MKEMKTLTVGGETYRITDSEAARIDDSQTTPETTWSSQKISDALASIGKVPGTDELVTAVIAALPAYNGEVESV